jgi:hypothetical protein
MSSASILELACMVPNKKNVYFSNCLNIVDANLNALVAGLISSLKVIWKLVYDDGLDDPSQLIWKLTPLGSS